MKDMYYKRKSQRKLIKCEFYGGGVLSYTKLDYRSRARSTVGKKIW